MKRGLPIHPLAVRVAHWVNAVAMVWMVMSGWAIYNASPLFGFRFPAWATIGGWLGGSIAWHFAAMWLLAVNGLVYLAYGIASGHFRRHFLPVTPHAVAHDLSLAARFSLPHRPGSYNAVQRLSYLGVLALGVLAVASGLSIWKPVQLEALVDLFGGYDMARRVHFVAMSGIVAFVVLHLVLVAVVPKTLWPMFSGRARS
ncbi:MAG TPA: cytochrome b/b6 domain-containing protein [Burkholderiaceae bacterium]|jgi:thiosulfate reductase cytochrome b subunit